MPSAAKSQLYHVFYMLSVREHVDRLDASDVVALAKEREVACLGGGIATDVYYPSCSDGEQLFDNFLVHAGSRRVGDDNVG